MNPTRRFPRILICRLSALGDCIHTLPVLCALRRKLPEAYLAWVTQSGCAPLLRNHRDLDELIEVPRGFLKSPLTLGRLWARLRETRFDIVIDPQSLTKSAAAAWLSAAQRRIGFAAPLGRELSTWLNNEPVTATAGHAVDQNLELLRPLGIEQVEAEFHLPRDKKATESIGGFLRQAGIEQPPVVVHPGAGWDSKLWLPCRYGEVAMHLGRSRRLKTVVAWAGQRCREWAEQVVAFSRGHAVLAPPTTLPELIALLRAARLYLGSDSGPLHMAAAARTPCIGLFGPSRPQHNGPYGEGHISLQEYYQEGTTRQRKTADNEALRAIQSNTVIAACERLLTEPLADSQQAA